MIIDIFIFALRGAVCEREQLLIDCVVIRLKHAAVLAELELVLGKGVFDALEQVIQLLHVIVNDGLLRRYQHFEHLLALAQILRRADHIGLCLLGTEQAKTDVVGATQNLREREQMLEMLVAAEQAVIDDDMEQLNYLLEGIKDAFSEDQLKLREDGGVLEANDYAVYQKLLALADSTAQSEDKNVNNQ